jgi:peptidoglycan biosynthesis protein MviN/MurJ (putative lipid II flippase)
MAAFDAMLKRTKLVTIGFVALSVAMIVGGGFMLFERTELRDLIAGAVLILLGGQVQLLVKLWYWQVHGRIAVQRDLRLVLAGMERP